MNDSGVIVISDAEFKLLSELIYDKFGIHLTDKKKYLVMGRLNKLLKSKGFENFKVFYDYIINDKTGNALIDLIDRVSTNHTFFFREEDHFSYLVNEALPKIIEKQAKLKSQQIKIWCAGCATGEEAYSIAISIREYFGNDLNNWNIGILATDISKTALTLALNAKYVKDKLNLPNNKYIDKYFIKVNNEEFEVKENIKNMVLFKRLNFVDSDFPFKSKFNIIFCRNVMIYFDLETRNTLVDKFYKYLFPGSYLFIGHSETIQRDKTAFRYIKPAIYYKED